MKGKIQTRWQKNSIFCPEYVKTFLVLESHISVILGEYVAMQGLREWRPVKFQFVHEVHHFSLDITLTRNVLWDSHWAPPKVKWNMNKCISCAPEGPSDTYSAKGAKADTRNTNTALYCTWNKVYFQLGAKKKQTKETLRWSQMVSARCMIITRWGNQFSSTTIRTMPQPDCWVKTLRMMCGMCVQTAVCQEKKNNCCLLQHQTL